MIYENQEYKYHANNVLGVLAGILVGGLAGADDAITGAAIWKRYARRQIREKGIELRDRTSEMMEEYHGPGTYEYEQIDHGLKDDSV